MPSRNVFVSYNNVRLDLNPDHVDYLYKAALVRPGTLTIYSNAIRALNALGRIVKNAHRMLTGATHLSRARIITTTEIINHMARVCTVHSRSHQSLTMGFVTRQLISSVLTDIVQSLSRLARRLQELDLQDARTFNTPASTRSVALMQTTEFSRNVINHCEAVARHLSSLDGVRSDVIIENITIPG